MDAFSKWPEVSFLGTDTRTSRIIQELRTIFSTHGMPRILVSDNGPQFTSGEFAELIESNGICHKKTPPYHPASNGLIERFVQELKKCLKRGEPRTTPAQKQHRIDNFLLGYRSTLHTATGVSPSELLFKRKLRTRLSLLHPDHANTMRDKQEWDMQEERTKSLEPGDKLWVWDNRDTQMDRATPWTTAIGPVSCLVHMQGTTCLVHVDILRKRTGEQPKELDKQRDNQHHLLQCLRWTF